MLVYFKTPTCSVCTALEPKIRELAEASGDRLHLRIVDCTVDPELAGQAQIFAVPALLGLVNGRERFRFVRHFGLGQLEEAVLRELALLPSDKR